MMLNINAELLDVTIIMSFTQDVSGVYYNTSFDMVLLNASLEIKVKLICYF